MSCNDDTEPLRCQRFERLVDALEFMVGHGYIGSQDRAESVSSAACSSRRSPTKETSAVPKIITLAGEFFYILINGVYLPFPQSLASTVASSTL